MGRSFLFPLYVEFCCLIPYHHVVDSMSKMRAIRFKSRIGITPKRMDWTNVGCFLSRLLPRPDVDCRYHPERWGGAHDKRQRQSPVPPSQLYLILLIQELRRHLVDMLPVGSNLVVRMSSIPLFYLF